MKSQFQMVGEFHDRFGLPTAPDHPGGSGWNRSPPDTVPPDVFDFRYKFLLEELDELDRAFAAGDLPAVADALADLVYVALGTAHLFRLPFDAVFAEVHRANMAKERAAAPDDPRSKRGHALDVVKPAGWTPPDVAGVLAAAGWTPPDPARKEGGGG